MPKPQMPWVNPVDTPAPRLWQAPPRRGGPRRRSRLGLVLALGACWGLGGQPALAAAKPVEKTYQRAKGELPEGLYPYYRMLDRIISANPTINQHATIGLRSLDEASCRELLGNNNGVCAVATELPDVKKEDHFLIWALQVAGANGGAPNAFAQSSKNRIVINKALDGSFANDLEAKACVVAHEMAHLQQDHSKQMRAALAEWNTEAAGKISSAVRNAHSAKSNNQFWTALAMVANAASAGYGSSVGNAGAVASATNSNQALLAQYQADHLAGRQLLADVFKVAQSEAPQVFNALQGMEGLPASLVARTLKDVKVYLGEVSEKGYALSRQQELEADRLAVSYLAKAGINPQGCQRVVAYLHRGQYQPVASKTDTHPGEQERAQNMAAAIAASAADYARAKTRAVKPTPLAYRYDNRLEVVTVYPATATPDRRQAPAPVDVDNLLGK
ncbi:MAG: M48 family metalloprotease [Cyanobacteriota bacterium]